MKRTEVVAYLLLSGGLLLLAYVFAASSMGYFNSESLPKETRVEAAPPPHAAVELYALISSSLDDAWPAIESLEPRDRAYVVDEIGRLLTSWNPRLRVCAALLIGDMSERLSGRPSDVLLFGDVAENTLQLFFAETTQYWVDYYSDDVRNQNQHVDPVIRDWWSKRQQLISLHISSIKSTSRSRTAANASSNVSAYGRCLPTDPAVCWLLYRLCASAPDDRIEDVVSAADPFSRSQLLQLFEELPWLVHDNPAIQIRAGLALEGLCRRKLGKSVVHVDEKERRICIPSAGIDFRIGQYKYGLTDADYWMLDQRWHSWREKWQRELIRTLVVSSENPQSDSSRSPVRYRVQNRLLLCANAQ